MNPTLRAPIDLQHIEPDAWALRTEHLRSCALVVDAARVDRELAQPGRFLRRGRQLELPDFCTCGAFRSRESGLLIPGHNIVTDAGDQYYAQKGCGETPTNFGTPRMSLTSAEGTPGKASNFSNLTTVVGTKAMDSLFPKTNDNAASPLNPGTVDIDVIAWRVTWTTAEVVATITGLSIHNNGATGSNPILNLARFATSFAKAATETLVTWANHRFNGV